MSAYQNHRHPMVFRILHEIIMFSILMLLITGFYIHRPFVGGGGFVMSMSRGVHNLFAITIIVAGITRIVMMFAGKERDWRTFIPNGADFKLLPGVLKYYAYMKSSIDIKKKYNPFQMLTYGLVFILIVFQIISGLALKWTENAGFRWLNYGIFNNPIETRMAHFFVTWLFILFLMVHVYLVIRERFSEIKQMHLFSESEENLETRKADEG